MYSYLITYKAYDKFDHLAAEGNSIYEKEEEITKERINFMEEDTKRYINENKEKLNVSFEIVKVIITGFFKLAGSKSSEIYILTAFGKLIDTVCEAFNTLNEAIEFAKKEISKENGVFIIDVTKPECARNYFTPKDFDYKNSSLCWKTIDKKRQEVEWQIHKKEI